MTRRNPEGTLAGNAGGGSRRIADDTSTDVAPLKGSSPVTIW